MNNQNNSAILLRHSYIGVRARVYEIESDLKEAYTNHVAKDQDDKALSLDEWRTFKSARDAYTNAFSRSPLADHAKAEYDAFVGTLNELSNGKAKNLIGEFAEFEQLHSERDRSYHSFTRDSTSESLTVFRQDLLQHLAGTIVVKEHRHRYQKEQFDRFIASMQYNRLNKNN